MMKKLLLILNLFLLLSNFGSRAQKPGLYVKDRFLYTPAGEKLILKGFNAMIVYWDIHGDINFPEIEKTGANCVRIFWKIDGWAPPAADLDKVLGNCIKHHMIPVICLWDATGEWDKLQMCVDYWTKPSIAAVLKKYEKNLIVNIANEAGNKAMGDAIFTNTYSDLVQQMRDAGIRTPLMIDADQWGRNANSVLSTGQDLLQNDPEHNLLFSWHLWDPATWGSGTIAEIDRIIETAVEKNICFVVGEFGPCENCDNCASTKINWEHLIEKAYANEIGYLPWVWRWTDCHSCVTYEPGKYGDWTNNPWGEGVAFSNQYSIQNTSVRPPGMITAATELPVRSGYLEVFPNPFTSEITFEMKTKNNSIVSLKIYDLTGNEVAVVEDRKPVNGIYQSIWKPNKEIADGLFFYELMMENPGNHFCEKGKFIKN